MEDALAPGQIPDRAAAPLRDGEPLQVGRDGGGAKPPQGVARQQNGGGGLVLVQLVEGQLAVRALAYRPAVVDVHRGRPASADELLRLEVEEHERELRVEAADHQVVAARDRLEAPAERELLDHLARGERDDAGFLDVLRVEADHAVGRDEGEVVAENLLDVAA